VWSQANAAGALGGGSGVVLAGLGGWLVFESSKGAKRPAISPGAASSAASGGAQTYSKRWRSAPKRLLIGRPYLYGLAVDGAEGVARVVNILREEFQMAMALTGRPGIRSIDRWS